MNGALLALVGVLVLVGGRFAVAYARDDDLRDAAMMTRESVVAVVAGTFAVGAMGLVQLADFLGFVGSWLAGHPFAASNGILGGIGALGAFVGFEISASQWLGLALIVPGLILVAKEVDDAV